MAGKDAFVVLRGEFDVTNHEALRGALLAAQAGENLTVDLENAAFLAAANDVREAAAAPVWQTARRRCCASCAP